MTGQTHRIRRQIFDLRVEDSVAAQQLQEDLSHIHRYRLLPLIEQCLNQISAPDQLHRIDSLELDLGTIVTDNLEVEMVSKLHRQLPERLAEAIDAEARRARERNQSPGEQSALELLTLFLRTGSLPWWADPARDDQIGAAVQTLLRTAPSPLVQLLCRLAQEQRSLARMVICFDDSLLLQVIQLLMPSQGLDLASIIKTLTQPLHGMESGAAGNYPSSQARDIIWKAILKAAASAPPPSFETTGFWKQVITQLALESNAPYAEQLAHLHHALAQTGGQTAYDRFRGIVAQLHKELLDTSTLPNAELDNHSEIWVQQRLKTLISDSPPFVSLLETVLKIASRLPDHLRNQWQIWLQNLDRDGGHYQKNTETLQTLLRLVRSTISGGLIQSSEVRKGLLDIKQKTGNSLSLTAATTLDRFLAEIAAEEALSTLEPSLPIDLTFSETQEYYVDNAGLVILWPFLTVFFQRLGLLQQSRFRDEAAVQRGVGLLQYLVTEHSSPPEYLLPLNKLLCGMDPEQVFDFGPPVTEAEGEECMALLTGAIDRAPILKYMSVTGFRGSFLLRKGVIGTRDGIWLLQVEKQSYDLVLERFPWSFSWVKLPWMQSPLRVEW